MIFSQKTDDGIYFTAKGLAGKVMPWHSPGRGQHVHISPADLVNYVGCKKQQRSEMLVAIQNFLIDATYLLAAFLWWKSATAAPQSQQSTNESLFRAYHELDTAIELIYICFDPRLLTSNSPFNPHVSGPALFNAAAALCTAVAVFLQFIRDVMSAWCDDQGLIISVMLAFLLIIFLFPFFKYFFRRWITDIEKHIDKKEGKSRKA